MIKFKKKRKEHELYKSIPLKDTWKWKYIEETVHKTMNFFNYKEIRLPLLLPVETVNKVYNLDSYITKPESFYQIGQEQGAYLRPDGTVTCLHDLFNYQEVSDLNLMYYIGPMFRRLASDDRPNGLFHQFGVEAIGADSYVIDVETIRLGLNIFKKFGLTNIKLEINSYGCPKCRPKYHRRLHSYWTEIKGILCPRCSQNYRYFLNNAWECSSCSPLWLKSPTILNELCDNCVTNFNRIKKTLSNLMQDFVVNPHLNMNFPYYKQIVFQYKLLHKGEQIILGSGGRYDILVKTISGKLLPAIGFSSNIETLLEIIEANDLLPTTETPFQVFIMATDDELETSLLQIVQELRDNEIKVIIGKTDMKYEQQTASAQKENCSLMIVVTEEAIREGKVFINNIVKQHKETISLSNVLSSVQRLQKTLAKTNSLSDLGYP